jgi:hypothetical protein
MEDIVCWNQSINVIIFYSQWIAPVQLLSLFLSFFEYSPNVHSSSEAVRVCVLNNGRW